MNEHVQAGRSTLVQFPAPSSVVREPRPKSHRLLTALVLVLLAGTGAVAWWSLGAGPAVHYTTVPVARGAVAPAVTATGTVNPELTIIVGTYVSGQLGASQQNVSNRPHCRELQRKSPAREPGFSGMRQS
jgi:hypothetical protein